MKHERYSLETNGQDRFNRLARYGTSDVKIQAVLRACGHLDSRRLERSLHLLLRREPVLTCRFVEESPRSHFEPIGAEEQPRWYRYQATEDVESAADHFLSEPIGLTGDQQIELLHLRGEEGDTVCVRLNHACCDGGGAKQCLRSLAQIYTELGEGGGDAASASGGLRDSASYFRSRGIADPLSLFDPEATGPTATWAVPYDTTDGRTSRYALRRVGPAEFRALRSEARKRGVTITAMVLSAFYATLFEIVQPSVGDPMEVMVTTDLRKFVSEAEPRGICNLSAILSVTQKYDPTVSFETLLRRVSGELERLKGEGGEVPSAVVMEVLGAIDFNQAKGILLGAREAAVASGKSSPLLSNLGAIPELRFGGVEIEDCCILTPNMHAPGFMLGMSTYRETLTLCVGHSEEERCGAEIESLLNSVARYALTEEVGCA